MSFHLDLWATAVLYHVKWGKKAFLLAKPSAHNLRLLQAWQRRGEPDEGVSDVPEMRDTGAGRGQGEGQGEGGWEAGGAAAACFSFPAGLQDVRFAVLVEGSSLLIPAGWIHAVFTLEDSCVFGWNFHTGAQLQTSLPLVLADWGGSGGEMQQVKAFSLKELVSALWDLAEAVVGADDAAAFVHAEPLPAAAAAAIATSSALADAADEPLARLVADAQRSPAVALAMQTVAAFLSAQHTGTSQMRCRNSETLRRLKELAARVLERNSGPAVEAGTAPINHRTTYCTP
ncbi:hypothetical protein T492DRAFT_875564 [Pavlovales sp. CCMP2436]|nr:hypothetical protein T492DRAFT_875564 [Pavlovales sp. CCMP2436]